MLLVMDNKFWYYGVACGAKIILEGIAFLFSYGEFYHWSPSFLTFAALIQLSIAKLEQF